MSIPRVSRPVFESSEQCIVCGEVRLGSPLAALRPSLVTRLRIDRAVPVPPGAVVCASCLSAARVLHTRAELEKERGELSEVEREIAIRAANHSSIADEIEHGTPASFGQRAADAVARVGGSWVFVLGFFALLATWCGINAVALGSRAFDPYPFILLNLVLSCLASIQAPIILMSQARMSEIDRIRATQDFRINLKAELEVAALHEKMDHLLHQQWDRMVELQQLQLEILEEMRRSTAAGPSATSVLEAEPPDAKERE
jgi:uncharacterized membrane protein